MIVVADADIAHAEALFSPFGQLRLLPGREIRAADVKNADALMVRSVTQVTPELLEGSNVRFIGSATSGLDHIDQKYLTSRNIILVDAKGSNANAVVDYCLAALASEVAPKDSALDGLTVGVVGAGEVGGRLLQRLNALGVELRVCDPLLQQTGLQPDWQYVTLSQVFACDVVSLHVPLTTTGPWATLAMVNNSILQQMKKRAMLINTSRGGVVDERALLAIAKEKELTLCFDVWDKEPAIDQTLLNYCTIATPHLAGYSQQAKSAAATRLAAACAEFFGLPDTSKNAELLAAQLRQLPIGAGKNGIGNNIENSIENEADAWSLAVKLFPLRALSKEFKTRFDPAKPGQEFDSLRAREAGRLEFSSCQVAAQDNVARIAAGIGFTVLRP